MTQLLIAPSIATLPEAPSISDGGRIIKGDLINRSTAIVTISDTSTRDLAVDVAGRIKGHLSAVEKTRKEIKEPFLRMCKAIDDAAATHVKELDIEMRRLNTIVGQYEHELRMELERKRQQAEAEQRRLREEAEAAQRELLRVEEETRRKEAERIAKGKEGLTEAQKMKALQDQLDAEQKRQDAMEAERQLQEKAMRDAEDARAARASGGSQRIEIDVDVLDPAALYAAYPGCITLTPNLAAIKGLIRSQAEGFQLPGVHYIKRPVFNAKSR